MHDVQIRTLLLDIEGTTTSVDFVCKTLFPYARRHLQEFLELHYGEAGLTADLQQLREEQTADARQANDCPLWRDSPPEAMLESAAAYVHWLMDQDRKSRGLKSLQGKIWEGGYRSGELRSHVYPDVPPALERWRRAGRDTCIFSSGSVAAQKLLFANTCAGDLGSFIRAYFDTSAGAKADPASYRRIGEALAVSPSSIYFLSDTISEVDAARTAGMVTALCARHEMPSRDSHGHLIIRDFENVLP